MTRKIKVVSKVLSLSQITTSSKNNPRLSNDFVTIARYSNAMQKGDVFPPILVKQPAEGKSKYLVIDGVHRFNAMKMAKMKHARVDIIAGDISEKDAYLEAVKRNITHGRQFSTQEVTQIAITLKDWNMSMEQISDIVRMPVNRLTPMIVDRLASISETGESIALKSALKNMRGGSFTIQEYKDSNKIGNHSEQKFILDSLISMIENGWLNIQSYEIKTKVSKLKRLLMRYK